MLFLFDRGCKPQTKRLWGALLSQFSFTVPYLIQCSFFLITCFMLLGNRFGGIWCSSESQIINIHSYRYEKKLGLGRERIRNRRHCKRWDFVTIAVHQLPLYCVKMHFFHFGFTVQPSSLWIWVSDFREGRCCSRKRNFQENIFKYC